MVKDGTRPERGSPGPVAPALCHPAGAEARHYRGKYYAELARRFPGGFDVALSRDPEAAAMRPPRGTFLVARRDGRPVGCVGLKGGRDGVAEIKRLWVEPSAQGLGLARRLMAAEAAARALGLHTPRLDTTVRWPRRSRSTAATAGGRSHGSTTIPIPSCSLKGS